MNIDKILSKYNIIKSTPLNKGWSDDEKIILEDINHKKMLLRVSNISLYDKRLKQYDLIKKINSLNIPSSKAIEFGILDDLNCYMLLSYIEGNDAPNEINNLTDEEQYNLGYKAGDYLKKIHNIEHNNNEVWYDKYLIKMNKKIKALEECDYKIPNQEELIKYYRDSVHLMKNRPMVICHGDYHLGNMLISNNELFIIDFDKNSIADPYDEFKPYCWNARRSEYFETGLVDGYFNNLVPEDFFLILKYYTIESMISHLPWAVSFGIEEIKIAEEINLLHMKWWNNFKLDIPTWYKHK